MRALRFIALFAFIAIGAAAAMPLANLFHRWLVDATEPSPPDCSPRAHRIDGIEYVIKERDGSWSAIWRDRETERLMRYILYDATLVYDIGPAGARWVEARIIGPHPTSRDRCEERSTLHLRSPKDVDTKLRRRY